MSTKAIVGLIAAIVVVGGAIWYFSSGSGNQAPIEGSVEGAMENEGSGMLASLIARAGSWKCEVTSEIEAAPSQGTVYVSGGKMRGDFSSQPEALGGASVVSHMINTGEFIYTWSDAYPQGMKMAVPPEGSNVSSDPAASGGVDYQSQVHYSCSPWAADESMFAPPAGVSFMELGDKGMMPAMPSGLN